MLYWIFRQPPVLLLNLFLGGVKVKGRDNLPKRGGFILASNHRSYLDPVVLGIACSRRLDFLARHDLFRNIFFSWLIRTVGAFPVKRDTADLSALKQALRRLKAGRVLVVFPEGTRQVKGFADHAYAGIGFLAAKAGVPIIPALIEGTEEAFPRGAKKIKSAAVSVLFGKEIHIEGGSQYQEIAQQILESIKKLGDGSPN